MDILTDKSLQEIYQAVKCDRLIKEEREARKAGAIARMDERCKSAVRFLKEVKEVKENVRKSASKNGGKADG